LYKWVTLNYYLRKFELHFKKENMEVKLLQMQLLVVFLFWTENSKFQYNKVKY
jgi:hypothetical protein